MIDARSITREAFENALTVAAEGKEAHGLYAVEDAQAMLEPITKFYWRQFTLNVFPVMATFHLWTGLGLPWYTPLLGVAAGVLITSTLTRAPVTARLFAPPGYSAIDVARASSVLLRSKSQ